MQGLGDLTAVTPTLDLAKLPIDALHIIGPITTPTFGQHPPNLIQNELGISVTPRPSRHGMPRIKQRRAWSHHDFVRARPVSVAKCSVGQGMIVTRERLWGGPPADRDVIASLSTRRRPVWRRGSTASAGRAPGHVLSAAD
jgi:hypothetical protein